MQQAGDRIYIDLEGIMATIREKITARGAVGIRGLGRLFRIADDDGGRSIDLHNELPKLMADIGVLLNKTEISELGRMLDRDGDGSISFEEFIFKFAPPMNQNRLNIVNACFDYMDKDGSGTLTVDDLKIARQGVDSAAASTKTMGKSEKMISTTEAVFKNLATVFDKNGDGSVDRQEFIDYYREMSANIDHDEQFEMLLRSAWGMPPSK